MKRLLKIGEFFDLKNQELEEGNSAACRPAKRSRTEQPSAATTTSKDASAARIKQEQSSSSKKTTRPSEQWCRAFLSLFNNEVGKDILWWLPGRSGEAFAMKKDFFEQRLLKTFLCEPSFDSFLENLQKCGFQRMKIPSLSGRILAFETTTSKNLLSGRHASKHGKSSRRERSHTRLQHPRGRTPLVPIDSDDATETRQAGLNHLTAAIEGAATGNATANLNSPQMIQAHYLFQQEVAHSYFALLWQELQRQLSVLLIQQSQISVNNNAGSPGGSVQQGQGQRHSSFPQQHSPITDVASLLQQQQLQQQIATEAFHRAALAGRSQPVDEQTIVQELNNLRQQQLSNLTYQIVALVAANLENQNNNSQLPEAPVMNRLMVKYLIVLVLLQLQQQQHNIEFFIQDRLSTLALIRSITMSTSPLVTEGELLQHEGLAQPINSVHMQQLLAEAAMLSLSKAHQLLAEAAILIPLATQAIHHQQQPQGRVAAHSPRNPTRQDHHHYHHHRHLTHGGSAAYNISRAGLPSTPSHARATTAR